MLRFLCNTVEGLRVEQKWLLVRLMKTYAYSGLIKSSTAELAEKHSVSAYVVRAVIKGFLAEKGMLIPLRGDMSKFPDPQERGRPQLHYQLDFKELEKVSKVGVVEGYSDRFEPLIDVLLQDEGGLELSRAQQLLLAVLLAYANEFGVIKDIGHSTLRRLAGMGASQLVAQLKLLVEKGYILRVLSGGVSAKVFGKLSSIYVLNLEGLYKDLNIQQANGQVSVLTSDIIAQRWVSGIYEKVSRACDSEKMLKNNESIAEQVYLSHQRKGVENTWFRLFDSYYPTQESGNLEVRQLFRELFSRRMYRNRKLFTRKLTEYVSLFLSESCTEGADIEQWKGTLCGRIREDIVPKKMLARSEEGKTVSEAEVKVDECRHSMHIVLAEIICGWAEVVAQEYVLRCKGLKELADNESKSNISVAIIPSDKKAELDLILVSTD